jgi:hypothetical protein
MNSRPHVESSRKRVSGEVSYRALESHQRAWEMRAGFLIDLIHEEDTPPQDHHRAIGIGLLQGPRGPYPLSGDLREHSPHVKRRVVFAL